jgi:hypothetical protein
VSQCNCSSQKPLPTTGIRTRDLWFCNLDLRPLDQPAVNSVICRSISEYYQIKKIFPSYTQKERVPPWTPPRDREPTTRDLGRGLTCFSQELQIKYFWLQLPKGYQRRLRYSSMTPTFHQNDLAMRNTADVTGGKPIAV